MNKYGWRPDLPDHRDLLYSPDDDLLTKLPPSIDLRSNCPATIYDQGQLGSCTGNAIAGAVEFGLIKEAKDFGTPSRLFIYYNERVMEGTVDQDAGAMIRDGIKSVYQLGAPPETDWPYDIAQFTVKPPLNVYTDSAQHLVTQYQRVLHTRLHMKSCLANGYPFVFGFTVYESFESDVVAQTGVVPMPAKTEQALGGHAVLCVGYDDMNSRYIVRNSWGPNWGDKGYFYLPYSYLESGSLASDFWTIRTIK